MPKSAINGIDLYYETNGGGESNGDGETIGAEPAVVFAHGAGGNHLSWWQQVPAFSELYRCVTFDHRGFGQSLVPLDAPAQRRFR